jgi:hypothetical protein
MVRRCSPQVYDGSTLSTTLPSAVLGTGKTGLLTTGLRFGNDIFEVGKTKNPRSQGLRGLNIFEIAALLRFHSPRLCSGQARQVRSPKVCEESLVLRGSEEEGSE